jgi:alcohol dehydrogenase class IV
MRRLLRKSEGEPTAESIAAAGEWLAQNSFGTLIAVGGGSVLDWARLSLAVSRNWLNVTTGSIAADLKPADRPRLVLVPTSCGSGAESAAVAVYSVEGRKQPVVSDAFLADRVVLDGQVLNSASPSTLASWMSDTLSHAIESFVSVVPNALAKHAAVSALQTVLRFGSNADVHCRHERLMEAGFLGGVAASNCSVGVVHAFAHTVASYGVPHGVANAMGLAAGISANAGTSEMRALLDLLGMSASDALVSAISPITATALADGVPATARAALDDTGGREEIAARMAKDVCLRSNPRRMDNAALQVFLQDVAQAVSTV